MKIENHGGVQPVLKELFLQKMVIQLLVVLLKKICCMVFKHVSKSLKKVSHQMWFDS
jgi:hypothetical protein